MDYVKHENNNITDEILAKIEIEEMGLSARLEHLFLRHGLTTALDIFKLKKSNYLTKIRGVGDTSIKEIDDVLNRLLLEIKKGNVPNSKASDIEINTNQTSNTWEKEFKNNANLLKNIFIVDMDLSTRTKNSLLRYGLRTLFDIYSFSFQEPLENIKNIGDESVKELEKVLKEYPVSLPFNKSDKEKYFDIDQILLNNLPLDIFSNLIDNSTIQHLKKIGFSNAGELTLLATQIIQFASDTSAVLSNYFGNWTQIIKKQIEKGKFHKDAVFAGKPLKQWIQDDNFEISRDLTLIQSFYQSIKGNFLSEELVLLFNSISERNFTIFSEYYSDNTPTLEDLGNTYQVTRERIRQIIRSVKNKLYSNFTQNEFILLKSSFLYAKDLGDNLSINEWNSILRNKGLITEEDYERQDSIICLLTLIRSNTSILTKITKITPDLQLLSGLSYDLTIGNAKKTLNLSQQQIRSVLRKVSFTGGIYSVDAQEKLGLINENLSRILEQIGLYEAIPNWFTIKNKEVIHARWPLLNTTLQIIQYCGPLELQIVCDGIRRSIQRHYDAVAPPKVIEKHLEILGFTCTDGIINNNKNIIPEVKLSSSEELFLELYKSKGPVLHFQEIIDAFNTNDLSMSSATTKVLPHSPIVQKIDVGLYTLRGRNVTYDEIEYAKERQKSVNRDPIVDYDTKGFIKFKSTIDSFAIGGSLNIYDVVDKLPNLGKGWNILQDGEEKGIAKSDEFFLWGLGLIFRELEVSIGDRIEIIFNTWNHSISVRKDNEKCI